MKAITLHQPWATLMAVGAKTIETRSWPTRYRGLLAIHAGKSQACLTTCMEEPFKSTLLAAGLLLPNDLALGAIVGICRLVDCRRTEDVAPSMNELELAFGDFHPGRYGWIMAHMRPLETPIPVRGSQGLWEWDEKGLQL